MKLPYRANGVDVQEIARDGGDVNLQVGNEGLRELASDVAVEQGDGTLGERLQRAR